MAHRNNLAYNTSSVQRTQKKQQPVIRRVEKQETADSIRPGRAVALILVVAAITSAMVFSMVQLTEITDQINTVNAELQSQQSESVRLNMELNTAMSISNIEEYAEQKLGLVQMDQGQVEYITLSQGNEIELPEEENTSIFEKIKSAFTNFVEYLIG